MNDKRIIIRNGQISLGENDVMHKYLTIPTSGLGNRNPMVLFKHPMANRGSTVVVNTEKQFTLNLDYTKNTPMLYFSVVDGIRCNIQCSLDVYISEWKADFMFNYNEFVKKLRDRIASDPNWMSH